MTRWRELLQQSKGLLHAILANRKGAELTAFVKPLSNHPPLQPWEPKALAQHNHSWAACARSLEMDVANLHRLAKRLGLKAS